MNTNDNHLTIGEFAKAASIGIETIRFYQRKGLLPEPYRPYGSIRHYDHTDVARAQFVKAAKRLGFSLKEIAQLLQLNDGEHGHETVDLVATHLADVRNRLADLVRMESALSNLYDECNRQSTKLSCPLITTLLKT